MAMGFPTRTRGDWGHVPNRLVRLAAVAAAMRVLVASLPDVAAAGCGTEPGDVALTPALYQQGETVYWKATCIPEKAFHEYKDDVLIIDGLVNLVYIGKDAFRWFAGRLVLKGEFPKLQDIGDSAFYYAGHGTGCNTRKGGTLTGAACSYVAFDTGLASLRVIGQYAFQAFTGKLVFKGAFPRLVVINRRAFFQAGHYGGSTEVSFPNGLPKLTHVASDGYGPAFDDIKPAPTLGGTYPSLLGCECVRNCGSSSPSSWPMYMAPPHSVVLGPALYEKGRGAYANATCIPSRAFDEYRGGDVVIQGGLSDLVEIGDGAFRYFGDFGDSRKVVLEGAFPKLRRIGSNLFDGAFGFMFKPDREASTISFPCGLPSLQSMADDSFDAFAGTLSLEGAYPELMRCYELKSRKTSAIQLCNTTEAKQPVPKSCTKGMRCTR